MNFEGVVMNVTDLSRSIEFYRQVFDFTLLSQTAQLATMNGPESDHAQVIVLREFADGRLEGARHIGLRAFVLEAESTDRLEHVASELDSRGLLVGRRRHDDWTAVVGRDPDGVVFALTSVSGGGRKTEESWRTLDDALYGIGE
jgi:catechol-2,3-dioxygenase